MFGLASGSAACFMLVRLLFWLFAASLVFVCVFVGFFSFLRQVWPQIAVAVAAVAAMASDRRTHAASECRVASVWW